VVEDATDGWFWVFTPSWIVKRKQVGITGVTPHDILHHYASGLTWGGPDAVAVSRALFSCDYA